MGRYFGLANLTKGQEISSYWKNMLPSLDEVHSIGKQLGWDLTSDEIVSGSYCDWFIWNGNGFDCVDDPELRIRCSSPSVFGYVDGKVVSEHDKTFFFN